MGLEHPAAWGTLASKPGFAGSGLIPQWLQAGTPSLNSPSSSPNLAFVCGLQICSDSRGKSDKITDGKLEKWKYNMILRNDRRNTCENIFEKCSYKVSRLCNGFGIQCFLYWQRKNSKKSKENKVFLCLREEKQNPADRLYGWITEARD